MCLIYKENIKTTYQHQFDEVGANISSLVVRTIFGHRKPRCLKASEQRICCRVVGIRSLLLNLLLKIFKTNLTVTSLPRQFPFDAGALLWLCDGSETASKAKFLLSKDSSSVIFVDCRQYCSNRSFATSAVVSVGRLNLDIISVTPAR